MSEMASQITSVSIVCSTIYSGADQRKDQSSASLAFVRGIHRWPVNSPHKRPATRKMSPFDDVIMRILICLKRKFPINQWAFAYIRHWFRQWIGCCVMRIEPFREPIITHYELNFKNKLHWNMTQNTTISQGNKFQKAFCQMSATFVQPLNSNVSRVLIERFALWGFTC